MLNIGIIEFLVIFFFLILLVKPKEIPKILKNFGLLYRKFHQVLSNIRFDLSEIELNNDLSVTTEKKKNKNNGISRPSKRIKK